ncbi:DUF6441 family protein [Sphingomonas sp. YL-JM2C]
MVFAFKVSHPNFSKLMEQAEADIARGAMRAMDRATVDVKDELAAQMVQAGFSARFSKAWDRTVYPNKGKVSINPAGFVESKAPEIMDAFTRGATIRPVNGSRYLWIPTKNVPRRRGRVSIGGKNLRGGTMTPEEVEDRFGDFVIVPVKGGGLIAFVHAIRARNNQTERRSTGRRRAQGRQDRLVPMFSLRRTVRMPKLLDLNIPAERGAASFVRYLSEELSKS